MLEKIKDVIKLMRIKHWIKNILIFATMFLSMQINLENIRKLSIGFFAFCLISSVVYIINDIVDREKDAKHEIKKNRPIASGRISVKFAIILAVVLFMISLVLNFFIAGLNIKLYAILIGYLLLNLGYSFKLKNVVLIDVFCIVLGFIARLYYGSIISNISISNLLYLTVMFASFFLGLGKRRNELLKLSDSARPILKYYNKNFLDKNMYVALTLTVTFYSLWAISQQGLLFLASIPLLLLVFFKYSLTIESESYGDPVDVVLGDKELILFIFIYFVVMICAFLL